MMLCFRFLLFLASLVKSESFTGGKKQEAETDVQLQTKDAFFYVIFGWSITVEIDNLNVSFWRH